MTRVEILPLKWPQVVVPYDEEGTATKWCDAQPGGEYGHTITTTQHEAHEDWILMQSVFFFELEENALLFALKFNGTVQPQPYGPAA